MKDVRVAIIGQGRSGRNIHGAYFKSEDNTLYNVVAVVDYGHWNFIPAAQMMWDYFKMFSRDPKTKKLIYHGSIN